MFDFLIRLIDKIAGFSIKEWVIIVLSAIMCLLGWIVYDLQSKDHLIKIFNNELDRYEAIDECILTVESDNHYLYRTIYLSEINKVSDFGNYDFWIAFVSKDNQNLMQNNANMLKKGFYAECTMLDIIANVIKENIHEANDTPVSSTSE